jgi:hypothetical protein
MVMMMGPKGATFQCHAPPTHANAHTLLVPKMKEITIYNIPHWTLWPAFVIFVFLATEGAIL